MINDEDDIKIVMISDNEYKLICSWCGSVLKYPTSWQKHRKTKKHIKMEIMATFMLNYSKNNSDNNNDNQSNDCD